ERDAELDGHQRKAFFKHLACGVETPDFVSAAAILARGLELIDQWLQDIIFKHRIVGRDIALIDAVEIALAHIKRVEPQAPRDVVKHILDAQYALRPPKAPEC